MKLVADTEAAKVIEQMIDITLKNTGVQGLQAVNALVGAMQIEDDQQPAPDIEEVDGGSTKGSE